MGEAGLGAVHGALLDRLGPQGWWPAETDEEVVIGAVLVQAVAWRNAQAALRALGAAGLLSLRGLAAADPEGLAPLCRPAGYYHAKARTLRALAAWVLQRGGLAALRAAPAEEVRQGLQGVPGVGPETADAILCYALGRPALIADAYTRRILCRTGLLSAQDAAGYGRARAALAPALPPGAGAAWLGELHALLVAAGKQWCRPRAPRCPDCPLRPSCRHAAGMRAPGAGEAAPRSSGAEPPRRGASRGGGGRAHGPRDLGGGGPGPRASP
jgi:endonuclease-3 related protein